MIAATISPNAAIAISARRKVEERSVLARSTETISDAADGVDQWIGLGIIDLAADATDIDVGDVGGGIEVQIPDMLEQHRTRDDAALVADEIFEQLEFPRQQRNLPAAAGPGPRRADEWGEGGPRGIRSMARSPTRGIVSLATVSLRRPSASSRASNSVKENGLTR